MDLYVGHQHVFESRPDWRNRLLRNLGDGTFADMTAAAGLDTQLTVGGGSSNGVVAGDFDNDGWPDLFLPVGLFLNAGDLDLVVSPEPELYLNNYLG